MERIKSHDVVRHFKGAYYRVLSTEVFHSEDKSRYVLYESLTDSKKYVRPYDMFCSEVDHEKYPDVKQKYRFEVLDA